MDSSGEGAEHLKKKKKKPMNLPNNSLAEALAAIIKPIVKEAVREAMKINAIGMVPSTVTNKIFLTVKQAAETSGLGASTIDLAIRLPATASAERLAGASCSNEATWKVLLEAESH